MSQKGKIRQIRRLTTLVVRKQIDLGLLPLRVVSKKKEPVWKGKLVSENTDEIATQSSLEQMGLLNPISTKVSQYDRNILCLKTFNLPPKQSRKRLKRERIRLEKANKQRKTDGLTCKERRLIRLDYRFAKKFKKSA